MEFELQKCDILILKRGENYHCERITLLDGQIMTEIENDGHKYFGIGVLDRAIE